MQIMSPMQVFPPMLPLPRLEEGAQPTNTQIVCPDGS